MPLSPGDALLNGQYHILRQLGKGGFGFVYLAQDTLLGEQVAIKELIPSLVGDQTVLKRFLAEAKATMRLTHERIVRTHNVFSEQGNYYIAMEFMAGGSLGVRLKSPGPLPVEEAVRIAIEICEGLDYAHQRGVVHCDLKPANILFTGGPGGAAKVADFGIAHVSDRLLTRTWHTSAGFVAGTLPYMSPEQADGVRDDPRIDVYALGAVLYRMLTGRSYLDFDQRETPGAQADNVLRIRTETTHPPSVLNRRVPGWLDAVVLKALAKQPEQRYTGIEALRKALLQRGSARMAQPSRAQDQTRPPPRAQARTGPGRPQPRRAPLPRLFWLLVGSAAVLLVAIAIILAVALRNGGGNREASVVTLVITPETTATFIPTPQPPTLTPAPTLSPDIYAEDFGDPNSGWDVYDEEGTQAGYQDGEYRLAVYREDYVAWGSPDVQQQFADFGVEVDARAVEGPLNNNYGLLVRYDWESRSFYWFQVSSDGYYAVDMLLDGEFFQLLEWQSSEVINQGLDATNHLKVLCQGNQFRFSVNGTYLADVIDDTLAVGSVGLAAGTFDEPGVVVHFDNLKVLLPQK
jgi:serine/threonine protein kinase